MEEDLLAQTKGRNMDLIVCSDAEAILGIGDQGVGVRYYCSDKKPFDDQLAVFLGYRGEIQMKNQAFSWLTSVG